MDSLSFVSSVIGAVAWPVAAVVIAFAFRSELRALVPLLRKLKAGPIEAEFERDVKAIEQEAGSIVAVKPPEELEGRQEMLRELARVNPRSAILEAWLGVESAVRKAALQRTGGSPPPDVSSPLRTMRELVQNEIVTSGDAALFHDLRGLRNQAVHIQDFNPSYESALEYVKLASLLEARLTTLAMPNQRFQPAPNASGVSHG